MTHHILSLNTATVIGLAIALVGFGYFLYHLGKEVGSQKTAVKFLVPRGVDPIFPEVKFVTKKLRVVEND